jgi:hypothetical protein
MARDRAAPRTFARTGLSRLLLTAPESELGQRGALVALIVLVALVVVLNVTVGTSWVPALTLVVPMVMGGLLLTPRPLAIVIVLVAAALIAEYLGVGNNVLHGGVFLVSVLIAIIAMLLATDRQRLGLSAGRGERMLLELRDRLQLQGELPTLPEHWHADVTLQSAGGGSFGGDFIVSTVGNDDRSLELALVDVSGKGVDAATRALQLSGALGGLLGSVPPDRFLDAANAFLLRQQWSEGFATAIHLTVDLSSGTYRVSNAGHPPAVHYQADSGRWELVEPMGTVLGVVGGAPFGSVDGCLGPHDALLLYTDGVVEVPGRDLSVGIDRLLGAADRLIPRGMVGGAKQVLADVAPPATDDRAVVLVWRG